VVRVLQQLTAESADAQKDVLSGSFREYD